MSEKKLARVYYADLWGSREEKYSYLLGNDVEITHWQELEPVTPYYFFVPKDFALQAEYEKSWKVTEVFKFHSVGGKPGDDKFLVAFTPELLKSQLFATKTEIELNVAKMTEAKRNFAKIISAFKLDASKIIKYDYRPFDVRVTYYDSEIFCRAVPALWNQLREGNLSLILSRIIKGGSFAHVFVSELLPDVIYLSSQTATNAFVFPLYLYPEQPKGLLLGEESPEPERVPNFSHEFLEAMKETLGDEPAPEEIFYYIYAVLYSPTYRQRYREFLKIDFPRIPLPPDYDVFQRLSALGKELVSFHLLKHTDLSQPGVGFPVSGSNKVEKVSYDEPTQRVYLNKDQYFDNVSKEVWEYRIGAYQVMEKYLKDRKGRSLSLDESEHYMKVAKAIRSTIELQQKVDMVWAGRLYSSCLRRDGVRWIKELVAILS